MADLKLGPLPRQSTVKVTIVLSEPLKEELDAYAIEHSKLYEPVRARAADRLQLGYVFIAHRQLQREAVAGIILSQPAECTTLRAVRRSLSVRIGAINNWENDVGQAMYWFFHFSDSIEDHSSEIESILMRYFQ